MYPREYSNYTYTQKLLVVHLANKYLCPGWRWNDYGEIELETLYFAMVAKGATIIELGAMAEQFEECRVWLYGE